MALSSLRLRRALSLSSSLLHRPLFESRGTTSPLPSISHFLSSTLDEQNPRNTVNSEIQSVRFFRSLAISPSFRQRRYEPTDEPDIGPDTVLFEGCDYNHWLITMDMPKDYTSEQMVQAYVDAAAKVFGSEEEAKKKIYACSTTTYQGFQVECSEEVSEKFKDVPGVIFVLPDSYIDPVNKEYGGDKYINGTIIPRPPPIQYQKRREARDDRGSRPPRNFGPPQSPPPQQNYGSPQGPPPQQNYGSPQGPPQQNYGSPQGPPQQNYGSPQGPPHQKNYGSPRGSPHQQNYGQPPNPPPRQNYGQPLNPAPQQNHGQPMNPPPQQNYGYPPPQQNYGQQQTPAPSQNYGQQQNHLHQPNHDQPQNLPHQQQYGHQQNFSPQNYGPQRTNFPNKPNYGSQGANFPNQHNYGPTGGVQSGAPNNAPEGWNNYQGGKQDARQGDQGGYASPDQRNFAGQGQRYMHSEGGGFGQSQGGSLGQEVGPAYAQSYTRSGDQRFSLDEKGNNILGGEQRNYADLGMADQGRY